MKWIITLAGVFIVLVLMAAIFGPQMARERCLEKGGAIIVGADMLCFDREGKLVR